MLDVVIASMAISISVGDLIAVAKLIKGIVSSLGKSTHAASEYRELERELFGLQRALHEIEHLAVLPSRQAAANAIKCAALSCQLILEEFSAKLSKYERDLGHNKPAAYLNAVSRKLQWELQMKDEVVKLRIYIAAHVGSLNMRLLTFGL